MTPDFASQANPETKPKLSDPETEALELGVQRYRKRLSHLRTSGLESCTSAGNRVLSHSMDKMAEALSSWIHHASRTAGRLHRVVPLLKPMKPSLVALLTCRSILDGITSPRTINSLAMIVGRYIEDEQKFLYVRRNHKGWWRKYFKLAQKFPVDGGRAKFLKRIAKESHLNLPKWSAKERCSVGLVCIEIFRQSTGIIEIVTEPGLHRSVTLVRATDEFMDWLEKSHAASEILHPVFLPMTKPCRDWDSVFSGGYRGSDLGRRPLIKTHNRRYLHEVNEADLSHVYQAVNTVQATPFIINREVLDVLKQCWERGLSIGDLPNREPKPFPERPDKSAPKEVRKTWYKQAARIKFENECERSKRILVSKTIWLAEKYLDSRLYFPHECDFRGRMYPTPVFLNVQSSDHARSLLTFAEAKPLTDEGRSWLAIHGANVWGHDKVSFKERLDEISRNHDLIMAIGKDPMANMDWTKADKPFAFLAFCIEWYRVHTEESPMTRLPVHIDGSNNGLQMFSLLLRDPKGGMATNCLPCDSPRDIYQDVADLLKSKLASSADPMASRWLQFGIDRKATKRVVMCMPYGLTRFSSHEYVRDWYLSKAGSEKFFGTDDVFPAIKLLTNLMWESIEEIVSSAKVCMDWLKAAAKSHVAHGIPIRWTAPNGLPVRQGYCKANRINVKTSVGSVVRQHRILSDGSRLSMVRNANAISPNFIHSLDAAVLMLAVVTLRQHGVLSFSCIHDSLGINAEDASLASAVIRESAISVFSRDILGDLYREMKGYLGENPEIPLDPPPSPGTMDLQALRDADYFFA